MRFFKSFPFRGVLVVLLLAVGLAGCDQMPTASESGEPQSTQAQTSGAAGPAAAQTPDRHIVGVTSKKALQAARNRAESVYRVIELGKHPTAVAGVFPKEARQRLKQRKGVAYVEPDKVYKIIGQTLPWGIDRIDADVAHANGETGGDNTDGEGGADIVIIDTGIDDDHPDLHENLATPLGDSDEHKAFETCKGPNCNYPWSDDHDHGTHVAGIADAVDNSEGVVGTSTEAVLHAAKVCSKNGFCNASDIAAALKWTADHNYDVANLSLGGSYSSAIDDAGKYAYDHGVLLVAAAGNDGPCTDCVGYPAANEQFIAVSATTKNDNLADFSSTGCQVELAGPGKDIYSTVIGGYGTFSGTSMAAPHVAGAGAQLMDNGYANATQSSSDAEDAKCYPTSPGGARGQLQDTAEDIGLADNEQGEGLVDVAAALGLSSSEDLEAALVVSTKDATTVGSSSATLNGSLDDLGGADKADVYFEWRESGTSSWKTTSEQTLSSTGDFSADISGLSSDTKYEFRAVAEASDGDTDTGDTRTFTTDSGSSGGDNAPTVDELSLAEDNSGGSPHADFDASWSVSDSDGDLDTVELTLTDLDDGEIEDSETIDVSGDSASGTTDLKAKHEENSGHEYEVKAVVTDSNGNTDSATATEVEDGS